MSEKKVRLIINGEDEGVFPGLRFAVAFVQGYLSMMVIHEEEDTLFMDLPTIKFERVEED